MTVIVVGAAIIDGDRLLAARRSEPPRLAGGWEFPGGKVEPGEADEDALIRECQEELGVTIRLLDPVAGDWPLGTDAILRVWIAQIVFGIPKPLEEHSELRWLRPAEWGDVPWLAADLPVIDALRQMLADRGDIGRGDPA